ncbi:hypothetical protein [Robiginitalea sp. IMCC43444]|uniref:hypothetical protein n=1 Tax=Robiginitalea sp. IMCC43444 TaxID=3459121 RepID=UPI004041A918
MTEEIVFIKGSFNPAEAADVLLSLLNDKIKFHTVKSLKLNPGSSQSEEHSAARIGALREAKKKVEELVLMAHKEGLDLEINSTLAIQLTDKQI